MSLGGVEKIFPKYYSDMKGLDWCHLYNKYHNNSYNSSVMNSEVKRLHEDEDVQKAKGIYEYLLCKDINPFAGRLLNLRVFDNRDKTVAYSKQEVFVRFANSTLILMKWKATILSLGAKVVILLLIIAKCSVKIVTERKLINIKITYSSLTLLFIICADVLTGISQYQ